MPSHQLFFTDLKLNIKGDILSDPISLGIYATDASIYQITPIVIVLPIDESDVLSALKIASDYNISILPRGGGTALAGQTVGHSMILDFSKYMNKVLEFNEAEKWIKVQPGLVRDELNLFLNPYHLHFAPDPATSSRANIGGMIGNNSSGTKSILYGKTVDHLLELKIALADGTVLQLNKTTSDSYDKKAALKNREGEIYNSFRNIIQNTEEEIIKRFPKVMRRVQGYNLDEFAKKENWNLAKIICGSEGTLAVILEAKINLEPLPKFKSICVVHFKEMMEAIRAVKTMLEYQPSAVEILDRTVIQMSRENLTTQRHADFIHNDPGAVQIVEFYGDSQEEVLRRPQQMVERLRNEGFGYAYPIFKEGKEYDDVWVIRKKGLGLMLGVKSDKKPIAFIEDASIPIDVLPQYIEQVVTVCRDNHTEAAVYAHASVGVIHVRPILDLRKQEDIDRFKKIAEETFKLVKKYKGSWSGEHGDGLVRSYFLKDYFGDQVYHALGEVKRLFDPKNLMNPGKIIDGPPIDQDLRYGSKYHDDPMETVYHYRDDVSFTHAVHMCTGVGECRKILGGTMCPSFKATRDEEHSTRGRANALRLAMSGQLEKNGLTNKRLKETLDLCLSCKACKSECPSNVDMAKLKSEVYQKNYDAFGLTFRDRLIRDSSKMAKFFSGPFAPLINGIMNAKVSRNVLQKMAGIDKRRKMPTYTSKNFVAWFKNNYVPPKTSIQKVVLFADTYLNYHEPSIGIAATHLLSALNYEVIIADAGCCQRPKISHGLLKEAKIHGTILAQKLDKYIAQKLTIVTCEPSCYSAITDDLVDLIDDNQLSVRLKENVISLDTFIANHIKLSKDLVPLKSKTNKVMIHGHCHQKALIGMSDMLYIFDHIEHLKVEEIPSGCCGMAGSFGYEKEHYDISKKIAQEILIPAIENIESDTTIVANGFSCRHQIKDLGKKESKHWVEVFDFST